MLKTKFYNELLKAKDNEISLIKVIDKIMPLIEKYSKDNFGQVDEDLRSILIEYSIKTIKTEGFAEKILNN